MSHFEVEFALHPLCSPTLLNFILSFFSSISFAFYPHADRVFINITTEGYIPNFISTLKKLTNCFIYPLSRSRSHISFMMYYS